jgi:hypothetical protein
MRDEDRQTVYTLLSDVVTMMASGAQIIISGVNETAYFISRKLERAAELLRKQGDA